MAESLLHLPVANGLEEFLTEEHQSIQTEISGYYWDRDLNSADDLSVNSSGAYTHAPLPLTAEESPLLLSSIPTCHLRHESASSFDTLGPFTLSTSTHIPYTETSIPGESDMGRNPGDYYIEPPEPAHNSLTGFRYHDAADITDISTVNEIGNPSSFFPEQYAKHDDSQTGVEQIAWDYSATCGLSVNTRMPSRRLSQRFLDSHSPILVTPRKESVKDMYYLTENGMKYFQAVEAQIEEIDQPTNSSRRGWKCKVCPEEKKSMSTKMHAFDHVYTAHYAEAGDRFCCRFSGWTFKNKSESSMQKHCTSMHTNRQKSVCDGCNKTGRSEYILGKHRDHCDTYR
ncbi:hypothetical protein M422DRAFT_37972, partial [Sphaerobolus stellatus SS14]